MKIEAALNFDQIRHDQDRNAHLVISLEAPAKEGEERAPICVVPVVDVSGSMRGPKLDYAKRSAIKLVEHLRPGDYTGLIAFESRTHVIIPPQKITPEVKEKMKAEIGKLEVIGGTNFAGGMLKAVELVNGLDLPEGVIHRIIMLTDGQANEGVATKKDELIKLFTANAGRVTASAFGYGTGGGIDQELLGDFATACKGNYAFIRDPDGALTAFGKELGGLISTYGTDLVLEISSLAGHEISSVVSDVDAEEEDVGGDVTIKIPEILAEERRDIVLAVKLKAQKQALPRPMNVFDVKLTYDVIDAAGKKDKKTGEVKAKVQFVKPGDENPRPVEALDKIVALAEVIHAQIDAEDKAKKGDYVAAAAVMHNAAQHVQSRGFHRLAAAANNTSGSVGSHAAYASAGGYLRSFRAAGTRGMGVSEIDEGAASYLAEAGVQMSNSVQTATSTSFADGGTVFPIPGGVTAAPVDYAGTIAAGVSLTAPPGSVYGLIPNVAMGALQVTTDAGQVAQHWVGMTGGVADAIPSPPPQTDMTADSSKKATKAKIKKNKSSVRW